MYKKDEATVVAFGGEMKEEKCLVFGLAFLNNSSFNLFTFFFKLKTIRKYNHRKPMRLPDNWNSSSKKNKNHFDLKIMKFITEKSLGVNVNKWNISVDIKLNLNAICRCCSFKIMCT